MGENSLYLVDRDSKFKLFKSFAFSLLLGNHYAGLVREVWKDMGGYQVIDLTSNPNFPNNPSSVEVIDNFDAPYNVEDNYGSRVRGYFVAPETGDYRYEHFVLITILRFEFVLSIFYFRIWKKSSC